MFFRIKVKRHKCQIIDEKSGRSTRGTKATQQKENKNEQNCTTQPLNTIRKETPKMKAPDKKRARASQHRINKKPATKLN